MITEAENDVLSDVEVILPWEVIQTCCSLQKNGTSCFLSVNKQDCTTSQLAIQKLDDDSIKIRITVMVLGSCPDNAEEQNGHNGGAIAVACDQDQHQSVLEKADETAVSDETEVAVATPQTDAGSMDSTPVSRKRSVKGKPRIPNAIDTSRLNKHLTAIWSSKRKKVPKKPHPVATPENEEYPQNGNDVPAIAKQIRNEVIPRDSQATTVIIVKTVSRQTVSKPEPVQPSSVTYGDSHNIDSHKNAAKRKLEEPPAKASHDIAERLKAKKQRFATLGEERVIDDSNGDKVTCELCGEVVTSYVELVEHVRGEHDDCTYVRSYLDEIVPLAAALTAVSLPCKFCGRTFSGQAALSAHKHECRGNGNRETKLGAHRRRVKSELLTTTEDKTTAKGNTKTKVDGKTTKGSSSAFVCTVCQKSFDSKSKLTRHSHIHGEPKYVCVHCDKHFHTSDTLSKHVAKIHRQSNSQASAVNSKPTPANSRPAAGSKPSSAGTKIQSGNKKLAASKLNKSPKSKSATSAAAVTSGNQFPCSRCKAQFSRMTLLVTHMRYCRQ